MSAEVQVFLHDTRLPSVEAWNAAIKAEGFDLILDPFDLRKDHGYRPAMLKGEESGFEWCLSPVDRMEENPDFPFKAHVGTCDQHTSLTFGSQIDEGVAAAIAGAVLAKVGNGYLWDSCNQTGFLRDNDAISFARKMLSDWENQSRAPAENIKAAIASILVPALESLGFRKIKSGEFLRLGEDIIQSFGVHKNGEDFKVYWSGQALYPLRQFLAGTFSPVTRFDEYFAAKTPAQANASMRKVVDKFMALLYPWFEETKTTGGMLDYLTEFCIPDAHRSFDCGCLLLKLKRKNEGLQLVEKALGKYIEYEANGSDWAPGYAALCREILGSIEAGSETEVLEKWKVQSLQNLGFKKLLLPPKRAGKKSVPPEPVTNPPLLPPIIPEASALTAAAFNRDVVQPAVIVMMRQTMPDFHLVEVRGNSSFFMRLGTEHMFDFVVYSWDWSGRFAVRFASNYSSAWRGPERDSLGYSIDLANLRLNLTDFQLYSSHESALRKWYAYGKSESELHRQLLLLKNHLAEHAPVAPLVVRRAMRERKVLRFGVTQVTKKRLTTEEKAALEGELDSARYRRQPPTNKNFIELQEKINQFVQREARDSAEAKDPAFNSYNLARELLLADLSPQL